MNIVLLPYLLFGGLYFGVLEVNENSIKNRHVNADDGFPHPTNMFINKAHKVYIAKKCLCLYVSMCLFMKHVFMHNNMRWSHVHVDVCVLWHVRRSRRRCGARGSVTRCRPCQHARLSPGSLYYTNESADQYTDARISPLPWYPRLLTHFSPNTPAPLSFAHSLFAFFLLFFPLHLPVYSVRHQYMSAIFTLWRQHRNHIWNGLDRFLS